MARKLLSVAGVLLAVTAAWSWAAGGTSRVLEDREGWATLPSGLELGVFRVDPDPDVGDGRLVVLRVDPARFDLRLSLTSETGRKRRAAGWLAEEADVLAAVNATMFDVDHRTAVGLLVNGDHVNRADPSRDNAVLAFDPVDPALPAARIVDRTRPARVARGRPRRRPRRQFRERRSREDDLRVTPPEVPLLLGVVARVSPRPSPPR